VHPFNAFCVFFYQLFDALDGKQARRTKSSSPLGELFDHGCDAMTTVFMTLTLGAVLRIGPTWLIYFNMVLLMTTFFISQWEVYFTGILELWYMNVTEGQFAAMAIYIAPFFFGADLWVRPVTFLGITLKLGECVLIPTIFTTFCFIMVSLTNMYHFTLKYPKQRPIAIQYLIPGMFTTISSTFWLWKSPHLLINYPHYFCLVPGFIFCNLVGRLVTARVCRLDFDILYNILVLQGLAVLNSILQIVDEAIVLKVLCVLSILAYLHFGICLIEEMTTYLKIKAFRIPHA